MKHGGRGALRVHTRLVTSSKSLCVSRRLRRHDLFSRKSVAENQNCNDYSSLSVAAISNGKLETKKWYFQRRYGTLMLKLPATFLAFADSKLVDNISKLLQVDTTTNLKPAHPLSLVPGTQAQGASRHVSQSRPLLSDTSSGIASMVSTL